MSGNLEAGLKSTKLSTGVGDKRVWKEPDYLGKEF